MTAPEVGVPFRLGEATIVPTYVRPAATPRRNGAVPDGDDGWYVEFRYAGDAASEQYRDFVSEARS